MEWGHVSRNVGLQHEIFAHFGQLNVIVARNVEYGRANMTITFRRKHVKLTWALMKIMNVVHHSGILHNNLSKDNIMLHF
jgi:hypothetical protein